MIPGFVSGLFGGGGVSMGVYKFYLGEHKSGKKEKYPYSNLLQHTVSIMGHGYFTMTNTHMKQQGVLLDLLTSTRKYQVGQLHRIETKIIMLWSLKNICRIQQNRTILIQSIYKHRIPTWRTPHHSSFSTSASLSSSRSEKFESASLTEIENTDLFNRLVVAVEVSRRIRC